MSETTLRIKDLPLPVKAAKADWLGGTDWMGFTPTENSIRARAQCQSTILRQFQGGYVIEYITLKLEEPNPGFENSPEYLAERARHSAVAGCLVAVHRLRPSARPLQEIVGEADFSRWQDAWAKGGKRYRWSVAFPIVESYTVLPPAKANEILGPKAMQRLFAHPSATLRTLNDNERELIAELSLVPRPTTGAWIEIADEIAIAEREPVDFGTLQLIGEDLYAALEGMPIEKQVGLRLRATRIAKKFVEWRAKQNRLKCDYCQFDPILKVDGTEISPRSLLDVHHKRPLDEGVRPTRPTDSDFSLLCPTCHRFEHAKINAARKKQPTEAPGEMAKRIMKIADHFSSLPVLDDRTDDEILGYDERGLPS
jgi:5-methylcytosine-specific restriction enzyme A